MPKETQKGNSFFNKVHNTNKQRYKPTDHTKQATTGITTKKAPTSSTTDLKTTKQTTPLPLPPPPPPTKQRTTTTATKSMYKIKGLMIKQNEINKEKMGKNKLTNKTTHTHIHTKDNNNSNKN